MSTQQFEREEENRGYKPQQADASTQNGSGTDVLGEPVNPSAQGHAATSRPGVDPSASGGRASQATFDSSAARSRDPPISSTYDSQTPADATGYSRTPSGNFPSAQRPQSISSGPNQSGPNQSAAASHPATAQTTSHSPYVQTTSVPGSTGKTPMDSIMSVFNKWSKKAEDMTGNYWGHLRTGPNVADTAMGRIALGTRAFSEGGLDNVYRQTFDAAPEEHLLKTYACYLSTSSGPVAGTLYISTHKLAFCSDRPLAIPQPPGQSDATSQRAEGGATSQPAEGGASTPTGKKASSVQQQHEHVYYKVTVPISQVESVNPSENTQKKPPEKYVQVKTTDGHEFWFLGFVNYDKGVKNLQEALVSKNATSPTSNAASYTEANPNTNPPSYGDANATTNAPSHGDVHRSSYGGTKPTTNAPSYDEASYGNPTTNAPSHGDINRSAYGGSEPTTNAPSYDEASYGSSTTNPPAYGDTPYGNARRTTTAPSYDDASYAADRRPGTGPPSYDDVSPTTNPPSHGNTTTHV